MTDIVRPGQSAETLNEDAMPANIDLAIYRGDFVEVEVELVDDSEVALDLTGLSAQAQLRVDYDAVTGVDFECEVLSPATSGKVRIYMSSATTTALTEDSYIWDFQLTNIDNDSRTYFTGDVTVSPEVTKP